MTEQTNQCGCLCHLTGISSVKTSMPPLPCCECKFIDFRLTPNIFPYADPILDKVRELEDKVATELEILKGFNEETQKGFNRLSERIDKLANTENNKFSEFVRCWIDRIEKLENLAKERADLINYESYVALGDRIDKLEAKNEWLECNWATIRRLINEKARHSEAIAFLERRIGEVIGLKIRIEKLDSL